MVSFILDRVTAEELADGIMNDDEARNALVDKMASRYASPEFTDTDRRTFLTKVQEQIYAKALDRAIERLNTLESSARAFSDRDRWRGIEIGHYRGLYERYTEALYELREAGKLDDAGVQQRKAMHTTPDNLAAYIKDNRDPVVTESVGKQWSESRDFWRGELLKFFPEPENTEAVSDALETERTFLSTEARRYASHYPESSDGRNTFIMFAEMIEARKGGGE